MCFLSDDDHNVGEADDAIGGDHRGGAVGDGEAGRDGGDDNDDDGADNLEEGQCPDCFLGPCIVERNREAPWIGPGQAPSDHNSGIRKSIYKRFWRCIANLGGWNLPQYVARKRRVAGGDWAKYHQREVMPDCVLGYVRGKYPNPPSVPYMGHYWI